MAETRLHVIGIRGRFERRAMAGVTVARRSGIRSGMARNTGCRLVLSSKRESRGVMAET